MKNEKIFVSGGGGYIGTKLIEKLVEKGFSVICFDRFSKGVDGYKDIFDKSVKIIKGDIRTIDEKDISGVGCVIDLSAKSKNTEGTEKKDTIEINQIGRQRLANISKKVGVKKYIRISGTSVYGQQNDIVNENSEANPVTEYSKANYQAEKDVLKLNDFNFTVVVLRFPSVFGFSSNMRWDQAVNGMVFEAFKNKKILVKGKNHRRPFVHILDAVESCILMLELEKEKISGQVFNVGNDKLNYRLDNLAKEIQTNIEKSIDLKLQDSIDNQSHRVSFKKIEEQVGFKSKFDVKFAVNEIYQYLEKEYP